MREKTTRAQLAVGLIGLGSTWELHYREAVRRLSSKLCVRAVCDAVHVRAAAVASEFRAATFSSPWQLSQRRDIKAWLILDPGWFGIYPAELAVWCGRPALFANCFSADPQRLSELFVSASERGESLLAEFPNRFAPATTRIRELLATKLGPVRRIEIDLAVPASAQSDLLPWLSEARAYWIGLLDWCACLVGRPVSEVEWTIDTPPAGLRLLFPPETGEAPACSPTATIRLASFAGDQTVRHRRRIECERGVVTTDNPNRIVWQTETEQADESLTQERSPFEIILDQFCRRALGGLVPVPTLTDAVRGLAMWRAATDSLSTGTRVSVKSVPHP